MKMDNKNRTDHQEVQKTSKPEFTPPKIKKLGNMAKISQTTSVGTKADGGSFPFDKMMCLTPPPAIEEHRVLVSDQVCQSQFQDVIARTVKPGDVVLDLGCGSGIHSLLAARAGASKVYAVDLDQVINFTRRVVKNNQLEDVVECIQTDFFNLELKEKVDVIISNLGFLQSLNDLPLLREKFLKPNGAMIPDALGLEFALASTPAFYQDTVQIWNQDHLGLNFEELKSMAVNHPQYLTLNPNELVSTVTPIEVIPLRSAVSQLNIEKTTCALSDQVIHGIGGWYSFLSNNEIYLSLTPPIKMNSKIWTNFLLPLETPLSIKRGETLKINISIQRIGKGSSPIWTWKLIHQDKLVAHHSNFATVSSL